MRRILSVIFLIACLPFQAIGWGLLAISYWLDPKVLDTALLADNLERAPALK